MSINSFSAGANRMINQRILPLRLSALGTSSLVALSLLAVTPSSRATDWTGTTSTDWFTGTNWSAGVPTSGSTVFVDTTSPNPTVIGAAGAQSQFLVIGNLASGSLTIQGGGTLSSAISDLGSSAPSTGAVTVDGAGSSWTSSAGIYVGVVGAGTLNVQNGAVVSSVTGALGNSAGSTGTANVMGAGSSWTTTGDLTIGLNATGTLSVLAGGGVSNAAGFIGSNLGSTGIVTVSGAGSLWTNSAVLYVGSNGTGTLMVQNAGSVTSASALIAGGTTGVGHATVDGTGSVWTNAAHLGIGDFGHGTLAVQNGGAVNTGTASIGLAANSVGTLTLQSGGTFTATSLNIATIAGSTGTLNIGSALGQAAAAAGVLNAPTVAFGAGTGQIVFNHTSSNYAFTPAISGAGSVVVAAGTTILSANNTYTGTTTVNGGTLEVDGSIAASSLTTVNAGGTLSGSGTVGNTSINGGTLAPGASGNAFAPLAIQGSLTFTAASTYLIQVSPTSAGLTNVAGASGTATLGGATVSAVFAPGSYVNRQYTILTAAAGVNGTFNPTVVSNNSNLQTTLAYDAKNVFLNVSLSFVPPGGSLNGNQQSVANALTGYFNANGGIPGVYSGLTPAGLTQASGELGTGAQQTTFNAMSQFMGLLTDPFQDRGRMDASTGAPAFTEESRMLGYANDKRPAAEREAYAMFTKAPLAQRFEQRWSVWGAGFGGSQRTDGNANAGSNTTTSSLYATAVGADYLFSPHTIAGFALAGGGTNFSINGLGSGRSDLFQAGAYLRHVEGPAYISAALAYGWQDITTDRTVTIAGLDRLRAEFKANAYSGRIEGGYRFIAPWLNGVGITPYAAGQFTTFDLPGYAESVVAGGAAFALAYGARSVTDTRSELGLRTDKSLAMPDGILTLRGRLAWAHDFNPDRSIAATFQALPGASFVVSGARQAGDSALTTAAVDWHWLNGWSAAASFEGEFSNVTRSYAGKGVVRYAW